MKTRVLIIGIALLLATGAAHAEAYRITGKPDHSKCTNCRTANDHKVFSCIFYYLKRHQQDPRWKRTQYMSRDQAVQDPAALSLAAEGRRACGR
jgi:hypothetical protein